MTSRGSVFLLGLVSGCLLLCGTALAHHSFAAIYDSATITELEGAVARVSWTNPHVHFTVRVRDDRGREEMWNIETNSVSILGRMGLSANTIKVGDHIRVAGNPARRSQREMFAQNILLGKQEVVLVPGGKTRWSDRTVGTSGPWLADAGKTSDPQRGIFRVWSTTLSAPFLFPEILDPSLALKNYPLTDRARTAVAAFDPVKNNPLRDCTPKGMPTIMEQPYPMEFVQQGENILLRLEEYDTVRTIHMKTESQRERPRSTLGYSVGRWDGTTLVVTTTGINWPHFDQIGIPLSRQAEIIERFTPSADGSRLEYRMTVTDPLTFTKPVMLQKSWIWLADIEVRPYKCTRG